MEDSEVTDHIVSRFSRLSSQWQLAFPLFFFTVTMFCFYFIGDGLRDAFDPKDR